MTVFENLPVGATYGSDRGEADCYDDCVRVLTDGLAEGERAGGIAHPAGAQAAGTGSRPGDRAACAAADGAGGLTEHECVSLVGTIKDIHKGTSIIWIEHGYALLVVVERLIVINGQKIEEGEPERVMNSPAAQEIYMGAGVE